MRRGKEQIEFGDFQTPEALANRVCAYLVEEGLRPASIVEPTCGTGTFLTLALNRFNTVHTALGVEINPEHLATARSRLAQVDSVCHVTLHNEDFFGFDWKKVIDSLTEPILVLGNPPWTTASRMGALAGGNLPTKSNFQGLSGLDAKTGKSNFDITEWMVLRLLECLKNRNAYVALLMKTSVARRVLSHAWMKPISVSSARMLRIDSAEAFGANADACLLFLQTGNCVPEKSCKDSEWGNWQGNHITFGMRGDDLAADLIAYDGTAHLRARSPRKQGLRWRSGIKHDCSRVLELTQRDGELRNQSGEVVDVEPEFVFPLLKGSAIANADTRSIELSDRFVILTQRRMNEDTSRLAVEAPRLWGYLTANRSLFDDRRSSIYQDRSPFCIFGVGSYAFRPWKVGVCGLYKRVHFTIIPPRNGRSVVLDDTSYFLSFESEDEARFMLNLLKTRLARQFFEARIFRDAKRPVTAALLQQLDLLRLAKEVEQIDEWDRLSSRSTLFEKIAG